MDRLLADHAAIVGALALARNARRALLYDR
jgi:hypothetical protein